MTQIKQTDYALPSWFKTIIQILVAVVASVISVMIYVGDIKTQAALEVLEVEGRLNVVDEQLKSLKELFQRDIKELQKDVEETNRLLEKTQSDNHEKH
jgi:hypothetical protein